MGIKNSLVSWYIRNVLMPKAEDIDNPGYVITKLSKDGPIAYARDVLLPEKLVVTLEDRIVEKYGQTGSAALYSAGKKAAYIYAYLSDLVRINNTSSKGFSDFTGYFMTYVAGTMASEASRDFDMASKSIDVRLTDYIVCSKNGRGYIFTEGTMAGIWAYAICDTSAECVHLACQGKGAKECKLLSAPAAFLDKKGVKYFAERDIKTDYPLMDYKALNSVTKPRYCKSSLRQLIDGGFFSYVDNKLSFKGERYFECDTHYPYSVEREIDKLPGGRQVLFKTCFDFGKSISSALHETNYTGWVTDYMSALGWGDLMITDKTVIALSHPWTTYSGGSDFTIFRGLISGLMSGFSKENSEFKLTNKSTAGGHLDVEFAKEKA